MPVYFPGNGLPAGVKPLGLKYNLLEGRLDAWANGVATVFPGPAIAGGLAIPIANASRLFVIGDSRAQASTRRIRNSLLKSTLGRVVGLGSPDAQPTGDGTLDYDPTQGFRWAAASDTPGPWVPAKIGRILLSSGSADRRIEIGVPSFIGMPSVPTSVLVNVTGEAWVGYKSEGVAAWANKYLGNSLELVNIGLGGSSAEDLDGGMLDWIIHEITSSGGGYALVLLGANDISNYSSPNSTLLIERLTRLYDALRNIGVKFGIVGESARYADSALTAMGAGRIAAQFALTKFQRQYASRYPWSCEFVETLEITANPASTTLAPKAGMVKDHIHYDAYGACLVGMEAGKRLERLGAPIYREAFAGASDPDCWRGIGAITGPGGNLSTRGSGEAAAGFVIGAASGTDTTIAGTVLDAADGGGKWQRMLCGSTASAGVLQFRPINAETLASLGLAVGNRVQFAAEIEIVAAAGCKNVQVFVQTAGVVHRIYASVPIETTTSTVGPHPPLPYVTPIYEIPSGVTNMTFYVYCEVLAGGSADVRVRNIRRRILS